MAQASVAEQFKEAGAAPGLMLEKTDSKASSQEPARLSFAELMKDGDSRSLAFNFVKAENENQKNDRQSNAAEILPALSLESQDKPEISFPWSKELDPNVRKKHMSYRQTMDGMVKMGEGAYHVARRVLGKDGQESDVRLLTESLKEQYKKEMPDDSVMEGVRIGYSLLNGNNIAEVLERIPDSAARLRIAEKLKLEWTEQELPPTVPFDKRGREGETRPERIDNAEQFLKDIAQAAIDVKAHELRARGLCAQGARLAFNQLPGWHIEGGSVDKSINKDPNGWRSGITLSLDLAATGLFDVVPLKDLGYKNLKEGYIVGRYHYDDYVKKKPSWGGEDMGDIDIMTKKHKPPPDDKVMYKDSFVLIPKGLKR